MKFAAFSGAFIEFSLQEAMETTKELGFDGIEIACREPHLSAQTPRHQMEEIKQIANYYHLEIPALAGYMGHFSSLSDYDCEKEFTDFEKILESATILDVDMIRVFPGGPNAFLAIDEHYEKAAYWIKKCSLLAKQFNKKVIVEIHNNSLVETVEDAIRILTMIEEDNVGLIHDAGNMYITDTDFGRDSVFGLGDRLFHIHVKDEKRINQAGMAGTFTNRTRHGEESFMQCLLGEGEVDHKPLFGALQEIRYDKWITLECAAPYPAKERMAHDLHVVKQQLNELTHLYKRE
ncbi:sugar phosphate isomerase/epimerase family protein [Bacillus timonensis]|uniref:sugar phosphate isomerase/epimerase family protein n=1 Tax=Bacillus timonensis TaxID=1033734 RepID=UPI00028A122B|nr:sugar phosphate isomerase/epimerase [Bacillus timonensis]